MATPAAELKKQNKKSAKNFLLGPFSKLNESKRPAFQSLQTCFTK
jgi:hypothetical protein